MFDRLTLYTITRYQRPRGSRNWIQSVALFGPSRRLRIPRPTR